MPTAAPTHNSRVLAAHATTSPSPKAMPTPSPSAPKAAPKNITKHTGQAGASIARPTGAYGIASNLARVPASQLGKRVDDLKVLGVTWIRYDIEWSNIQYQGPDQYDWSSYDRVVQAVSARGIQSLLVISYTPAWARRSECSGTSMCAPNDPAAYAAFTAAVASRYKGYGVHSYEIWNEPNNASYFQPAANPALYTAMLKASYVAIKVADPQSRVITGGTSPAGSSGGYLSPPDFVNGIYVNGGQGYFDAVAHHPYTWPYSPAYPNQYNAWGQLTSIHNMMVAHGDGDKKIWMTEFGSPTGGPGTIASSGMTTSEGHADHVTEALQAKVVADAITLSRSMPWAGPLFWYSYMDAGTTSDTVENFFGLLRADGSAKPAYFTFKSLIGGQ